MQRKRAREADRTSARVVTLWTLLAALLGVASAGCYYTLPDTRAMVHTVLAAQRAEDRSEETSPDRPPGAAQNEPEQAAFSRETLADVNSRLRRYLKIEAAMTGAPLIGGNKLELLQNGPAAYNAMFTAMQHARNSINLETFIFTDDDIGRRFASLLERAHRRGVQTNVIYDSFGSLKTSAEFFDQMRQAGVSEFNPINPFRARFTFSLNHRDHRKLLIIDGKTAFTGGINISGDYEKGISGAPRGTNVPDMWRDTDVEIQGPAVTELQKLFVAHWVKQTGHLLPNADYFPDEDEPGNVSVRVIGSSQDASFSQMYVAPGFGDLACRAQRLYHESFAYLEPVADGFRNYLRPNKGARQIRVILHSKGQIQGALFLRVLGF